MIHRQIDDMNLYFSLVFVKFVFLELSLGVTASVRQSKFYNTGFDNVHFTDGLLFRLDHGVESVFECASRCARCNSCKAFTYVKGKYGKLISK